MVCQPTWVVKQNDEMRRGHQYAKRRHLPQAQKGAIYLSKQMASEDWEAKRQEAKDAANRKRSEATKTQPRTEDGKIG